jgi:hypothetical protein
MRASGFNHDTYVHIMSRVADMRRLLKTHTYVGDKDFLVTHAGVSQQLLAHYALTLDEYFTIGDFSQIGRSRNGSSVCGGLYWCDWRFEFEPITDQPQIVGHTRNNHIRRMGNSYCVDVLENDNPRCLLVQDCEVLVWNLIEGTIDEEYKIIDCEKNH